LVPDETPAVLEAYFEAAGRADLIGGPDPLDHVRSAWTFSRLIDRDAGVDARAVLDLGSGGGLPGLLVAHFRPDLNVTLLDSSARRCAFLERWATDLVPGTRVVHGRAEEVARDPEHRRRYSTVTARLFGPPAVTAECAVGFIEPGGLLLVSEPPGDLTDRWPGPGLAELGFLDEGAVPGQPGRIRRLRLVRPDDRFPRRVGRPAKQPLF